MANTPPGNTLQPTALVNEAYLRLARSHQGKWNSRGHFFASAAEAMRQILVEQVRHKSTGKAGGDLRREDLEGVEITAKERPQEILAIDEALTRLEDLDPDKAAVVKLRVFAGFSREEAAEALELSLRTCDRHWRYAIACMHRDLSQE
jgi:RNA polymerase sigma factor (TIGR02999 family)